MSRVQVALHGYDALRAAVLEVWAAEGRWFATPATEDSGRAPRPHYPPDDDPESSRIAALVDLARGGDHEAFGSLYDHYSPGVYRFVHYRVGNQVLAEDLTSETFFRALRSMAGFTWQGKDFGAWLTTIARNLVVDHYKSSRTRLETATDDFSMQRETSPSPEDEVLSGLTNDALRVAMGKLPAEQQECLVLRFINGNSIHETAKALNRSEGAVKQLQLRAVRNLAKLVPRDLR